MIKEDQMTNRADIPEDEDGVDRAFDSYNNKIRNIQSYTVWVGAKELSLKNRLENGIGFTREQLAEHINFNINIVNHWVHILIERGYITENDSKKLAAKPEHLIGII
jgi:hypothetical protein